ncbi:TPA: nucleotidyl transferase AbiEii/AbiGii toxin family protein [Salmonella enterica subsp. salamae serovar 51:c:-]|nr:nucleotidyl transferase AbiEii/AbiGii toxin family protein [Salmonella enterica subsp. salamae serovar 51:c:-]
MTNIFTLANPIFSATETLLSRINRICTAQGIPFFIAGATAREILLYHVHARSTGRRTRDIDIAVFVDGWPMFDALKNAFLAEGAQAVRDNAHRMIAEGIELDIIPFGGVAEGNRIAWPPEREIIMAVDGFAEVFSHTVTVQLDNGENLSFCSLPGLALLKLFAWRDRGHGNAKDATDLYKIIREYGAIEDERIYESPVEGESLNWDPVRMGAVLLGSDIAAIGERSSLAELMRLDRERLTDAIVRQSGADDMAGIEQVMHDFWDGMVSSG